MGGRVVPVEGEPIEGGTILLRDGKIAAVERPGFAVPPGTEVIDATGKWVLPGFIDAHAHAGVAEEAEGWAGQDTNERTDPNAAHVRALDAINPADQGFRDAIGGGVLAVNVNPGSANPIGGQTVAIKCWGRTVDEMVLREPAGLKSALGENPKRVYGERNETPSTRLGTAAVIRGAFVAAQNYQAKLAASALKDSSERTVVDRDLKLEALSRVLRREIPWRQHCHRADDIATAMRMAREFGYDLVIDHGTEAYLLADQIAAASDPGHHRAAVHQPVQGRAAQPVAGQPGQARGGRGDDRHHHRPPGGADPLPHPPGHAGGQGGPGPGDGAAGRDDQPGPDHRLRRPDRLAYRRQGR